MGPLLLLFSFYLLLAIACPLSQAGIKQRLEESAAYPREFGLAMAALIGERRPALASMAGLTYQYPGAGDDMGALDDLLRGADKCWWRHI